MKKSRFSEEQIVGMLKEAEAGVPVKELCRRLGISDAAIYARKTKRRGVEFNEARRLRQLKENGRLKKIVAQQTCDHLRRIPPDKPNSRNMGNCPFWLR